MRIELSKEDLDKMDEYENSRVKTDSMTILSYPDKMTVDEFCQELELDLEEFAKNMKILSGPLSGKRYPEKWIKTLAAWMEMLEYE